MKLIRFIQQGSPYFGVSLVFLGVVVGLCNTLLLSQINTMITDIGEPTAEKVGLYFLTLAVAIGAQRFFQSRLIRMTQNVIRHTRLSVINDVRKANLIAFEKLGPSKVFAALTYDTMLIGEAASFFANTCTAAVTVVYCLAYMGYISFISLGFTLFVLALGTLIYYLSERVIVKDLRKANENQEVMFDLMNDLLSGFKEMKMNDKKSGKFFEHVTANLQKTEEYSRRTLTRYMNNAVMGELLMLLMISAMIFLFPLFGKGMNTNIVQSVVLVLYMVGPVTSIFGMVPVYAKANLSIDRINQLKSNISDQANLELAVQKRYEVDFEEISLEDICFSYDGANSDFSLGPISLTVKRGEMLFIAGGNGSGKSTFMKILLGLYYSGDNRIYLNGNCITINEIENYRSLFSCVFSDHYLFRNIYHETPPPDKRVNEYLKYFMIDHVVSYKEARFHYADLSTGQKKRLSLIYALLEDKPILVLDEWAADQDPVFRKYFYEEILTALKNQGKTIIAVTHDDKYYDVADRIIHLEYGRVKNMATEPV